MEALCIGLFALGFLNRDGFPATGETQLARFLGGAWCAAGAAAVLPPLAAAGVGLAIWLGFYTDQKHAAGQRARGWNDAKFLALSGATSLAPLVLMLAFNLSWCWLALPPFGLAKVPIYVAAWRINPARWWAWAQPTRVAAILFGATVGWAVAWCGRGVS